MIDPQITQITQMTQKIDADRSPMKTDRNKLLCESLSLPSANYCRGYLQNRLDGETIPDKSA